MPEPMSPERRQWFGWWAHEVMVAFLKDHRDGSRAAWVAAEALDKWADALAEVDRLQTENERQAAAVEAARAFITARFVDRDAAERVLYDALAALRTGEQPDPRAGLHLTPDGETCGECGDRWPCAGRRAAEPTPGPGGEA